MYSETDVTRNDSRREAPGRRVMIDWCNVMSLRSSVENHLRQLHKMLYRINVFITVATVSISYLLTACGQIIEADPGGGGVGTPDESADTGQPIPPEADAPVPRRLYWTETESDTVRRSDLDGSNIATLVTIPGDDPDGLSLDSMRGTMYWSAFSADRIYRANLDGSNPTIISNAVDGPDGIRADSSATALYWVEHTAGQVVRSNHDGSAQTVLATGLDRPSDITIDRKNGVLYVIESVEGRILRMDLDGGNQQTIAAGLVRPICIALDAVNGHLYWTLRDGGIQRANLDGSNLITFDTSPANATTEGIALDLDNGHMYWTHLNIGTIERANLDGSDIKTVITGLAEPRGLVLAP